MQEVTCSCCCGSGRARRGEMLPMGRAVARAVKRALGDREGVA